jgi:hypothetical protein
MEVERGVTVTFTPAKREAIPLLLGIAGGTGSGKSLSALLLARGIAQGQPFAYVDTENGRGLHYADAFPEMQHGRLDAPFRPERFTAAIADGSKHLAGIDRNHRVVVVDSFSHEWAGDGGCLDWKDELAGGSDAKAAAAWAKVKPAHKRMMTQLLALEAHVILCLRAEEKMDIVKDDKGRIAFVPKRTLPGGSLDGWVPITEKNVMYECTASFLLAADAPGVPRPMKLQEQHRPMVPLDRPLNEQVGSALAAWAAGSAGRTDGGEAPVETHGPADEAPVSQTPMAVGESASPADITAKLIAGSSRPQQTAETIAKHELEHDADAHLAWLLVQAHKRGVAA